MSIHKRAKDMGVSDLVKKLEKLEEENRELRLENAKLKDRIITDENFEDKLAEENEKLKGDIERMKIDTMYDMKDIYSLYKENEKLREDVEYRYHRCMVAERGGEDNS